MTKINNIQILDDIELEDVVGGAQTKASVKKMVRAQKKPPKIFVMNGGSNAVTGPDSAV